MPTIADYFKVSTDYLLGRTDEPSPSLDIQAIHKKTGLSEKAIEELAQHNDMSVINFLMENLSIGCVPLFTLIEQFFYHDVSSEPNLPQFGEIIPTGKMLEDIIIMEIQQELRELKEYWTKEGKTNA
jgi:hypothetical protein